MIPAAAALVVLLAARPRPAAPARPRCDMVPIPGGTFAMGTDHGMAFEGPAVVETKGSTTVVDPGDEVVVDEYGNLVIRVNGSAE